MGQLLDQLQDTSEDQKSQGQLGQILNQDDSAPVKASVRLAQDIEPDHAAKVLNLADQTGLPTDVVSRNVDTLRHQQTQATISPQFVDEHPVVSSWLGEDPHHAALAGQDIPILGTIEKQFSYLANQTERGFYDLHNSYLKMKEYAGISTPDDVRMRQLLDKRLQFDLNKEAPGPISKLFGKVAETAPQIAGITGLAALGTTMSIPVGATVGAGFGAMAAGDAYADYKDRGMPDTEARHWATTAGVINGVVAAMGGEIMAKIPGLRLLTKEAIANSPAMRTALAKYVVGLGESGLTMGSFSGIQSLVQNGLGDVAQMPPDASPASILSTIFSKANVGKAAEAAKGGAATGFMLGAGLGTWGIWKDYGRSNDAINTERAWNNVGTMLQTSKMQEIAPEQAQKLVKQMTKDGHVYVPIEHWQPYWEGQKLDPREVYKSLTGNTDAYDESMRTGADIQIPMSDYVKIAASEEHGKALNEIVRASPDAMNSQEAKEFMGQKTPEQQASKTIADEIAPAQAVENVPRATTPSEQTPVFEQLAATESELGHKPLFEDLKAAGMSDERAARYTEAIEKARGSAQEDLARKMTDIALKKKTSAYQQERSEVEKSVSQEVAGRKDQIALTALQKGVLPNDVEFPLKLSKEAIKNDFPDIDTSKLPRGISIGKQKATGAEVESYAQELKKRDQIQYEYAVHDYGIFKEVIGQGIDTSKTPDIKDELSTLSLKKSKGGRGFDEVVDELRARNVIGENEDPIQALRDMKAPKRPAAIEGYLDQARRDLEREQGTQEGAHPDQVALLLGYQSGSHMLHDLSTMPDRDSLIQSETDRRMIERHPDIGSDTNLPEQAIRSLHNEDRAKLLRAELEHLASADFSKFMGLTKAMIRRAPSNEEIRSDAEKAIGRKTYTALNQNLYLNGERLARNEAADFYKKGDIEKAFEAKQRELLNFEMFREAQKAKDAIDKGLDFQSSFDKKSIRDRLAQASRAGGEWLDQIDAFRERFDFRKSVSMEDAMGRKSLIEFMAEQDRAGNPMDLPTEIRNPDYRPSWKSMTVDQLADLFGTLKQMKTMAYNEGKMLADERARSFDEVKNTVAAGLEKEFGPPEPPKWDFHPDFKDWGADKISSFNAWRTRPEFFFRWMDGGEYHGPVWETFMKPVNDAEDFKTEHQKLAVDKVNEIFKDYTTPERAKFYSKLQYIPEIDKSMNKMEMMMTVLHWGNEGNRAELMKGYGWDEAKVRAIWSHLEPKDFKTAENIWGMIDSLWPEVRQQEIDLKGVAPEKVEASPFKVTLKDGNELEMKGGYFPLVYDRKIGWKAGNFNESENVNSLFGTNAGRAATQHGWTNERDGGGGLPPSLNMSTFTNHISDVIHDLSYRKPVIDLYKLINDPDIRNQITSAAGKAMYEQLNPWLKRMAGDRPWAPLGPLEALTHLQHNMTMAELGLNFASSFIHTTSYLTASRELGPQYALSGLRDSANIFKAWDFVRENSEFMRARPDNFDRDWRATGRTLNIAGVAPGPLSYIETMSPIKRAAFKSVMQAADLGVAIPTWMGAYRKAMEGGVQNIDANKTSEAIEYADNLVRDTKGSGSAKDMAAIQSAGGQLGRLFTMFYTQINVMDNQMMMAGRQYAMDKDIPKLAGTMAMVWFLQAPMIEAIRGHTPGDDESWLKWAAKSEVLFPMRMVPGLREFATYMENRKGVEITPVNRAVETLFKTAGNAMDTVTGQKDEWTDKDYKDAIMSAGYLTGLPTRQPIKTMGYLHDWMTGDEQPASIGEGLYRSLVGKKPRG